MKSHGEIITERNAMNASARSLRRSIKTHCYQEAPEKTASQLIQWGGLMLSNRERPKSGRCLKNRPNLLSLSEDFKSEQAVQLLKALDRFIYGAGETESAGQKGSENWNGKQFWKAIAPYLNKSALKKTRRDADGLPSLYRSR